LIEIPPAVQIKSTIKSGSVYYFTEEIFTSDEPHYFIVINQYPIKDEVVLLVCASSQIQKVKRRRRNLPGTIVEIERREYIDFTKDSIIDCNDVLTKKVEHLVSKLREGKLRMKTEMDMALVEKLRKAVIQSPVVEEDIKKIITP